MHPSSLSKEEADRVTDRYAFQRASGASAGGPASSNNPLVPKCGAQETKLPSQNQSAAATVGARMRFPPNAPDRIRTGAARLKRPPL